MPQRIWLRSRATHHPSSARAITSGFPSLASAVCCGNESSGWMNTSRRQQTASQSLQLTEGSIHSSSSRSSSAMEWDCLNASRREVSRHWAHHRQLHILRALDERDAQQHAMCTCKAKTRAVAARLALGAAALRFPRPGACRVQPGAQEPVRIAEVHSALWLFACSQQQSHTRRAERLLGRYCLATPKPQGRHRRGTRCWLHGSTDPTGFDRDQEPSDDECYSPPPIPEPRSTGTESRMW